jgi:hypothetical protein
MTEPFELPPRQPSTDPWINRVREADAEAEAAWKRLEEDTAENAAAMNITTPFALYAIAAELRAQRIARRPGLGQK